MTTAVSERDQFFRPIHDGIMAQNAGQAPRPGPPFRIGQVVFRYQDGELLDFEVLSYPGQYPGSVTVQQLDETSRRCSRPLTADITSFSATRQLASEALGKVAKDVEVLARAPETGQVVTDEAHLQSLAEAELIAAQLAPSDFEFLNHCVPAADLAYLIKMEKQGLSGLSHQNCCVVIIGTWTGLMASVLARQFGLQPGQGIYCIDHFEGNLGDRLGELAKTLTPKRIFQAFCKNLSPYLMTTVFPLVGRSLSWASVWPPNRQIDLLIIDASHTYEDCKADLAAWSPHVEEHGTIMVHDYGKFPGVTRAVDELGAKVERVGYCFAKLER